MRVITAAAAAFLASAIAAQAAPATVSVAVGPELQAKAENTYGVRDIERLTEDLRVSVERALARREALADSRVELVLVDAKPNRPTFKQLTDVSGLSMNSFGIGGARIEGQVVGPDGGVRPVTYSWYETDIRQAYGRWVWTDAEWAFDRFATRLARGEQFVRR